MEVAKSREMVGYAGAKSLSFADYLFNKPNTIFLHDVGKQRNFANSQLLDILAVCLLSVCLIVEFVQNFEMDSIVDVNFSIDSVTCMQIIEKKKQRNKATGRDVALSSCGALRGD